MYANSLWRYLKSIYNGRKMSQKFSNLPSIAVCLSSFNGVLWLSEQIDSIHSQSGVVLTVFISVDVSSDGTEKWIDQAAGRDSRIKVLPHGQHFGGVAQIFFRLLHDIKLPRFPGHPCVPRAMVNKAEFNLIMCGITGKSSTATGWV
tara:strand:+ start:519 stop:959 length:441 start_codon:yes stop_codon:yes gene_type:complete